jgi:hypothetical protein
MVSEGEEVDLGRAGRPAQGMAGERHRDGDRRGPAAGARGGAGRHFLIDFWQNRHIVVYMYADSTSAYMTCQPKKVTKKYTNTMNPQKERFIELFKSTGWSQAETARQMDMTRGGVNGIVTGPTLPSSQTVRFMEMMLLEKGMAVPGRPGAQKVAELAGKLGDIRTHDPRHFKTVKKMIDSLHRQLKVEPTVVSTGTKSARKRLLSKAVAGVRSKEA